MHLIYKFKKLVHVSGRVNAIHSVDETDFLRNLFRVIPAVSHPAVPPRILFISRILDFLVVLEKEHLPKMRMKFLPACQKDACSGQDHVKMIAVTDLRPEVDPGITSLHPAGDEAYVPLLIVIIFEASVMYVSLYCVFSFHMFYPRLS
jgi:hypothetical protein